MFETLDKIMLAGLGAMSMTKEKAESIFDEYVEKGKAQKEQRAGFVKEVMDQAQKAKDDLEKVRLVCVYVPSGGSCVVTE